MNELLEAQLRSFKCIYIRISKVKEMSSGVDTAGAVEPCAEIEIDSEKRETTSRAGPLSRSPPSPISTPCPPQAR
ncbi:MAG: hypothetical protein SGPRY_005367, partial [Prymnesium sp.]